MRNRLGARDLFGDLLIDLDARKWRMILLMAAVALSTGALVTSIGIAQLASRQIDAGLAASSTDVFTVQNGDGDALSAKDDAFDTPGLDRVRALQLVSAAGLRIALPDRYAVSRLPVAAGDLGTGIPVIGVTSGYLDASDVRAERSYLLDATSDQHVAILSDQAAEALGIPQTNDPAAGYQIWIGADAYDVVEVLPPDGNDTGASILIPYAVALSEIGSTHESTMLVEVAPGAGGPVSRVVPLALRPAAPDTLQVSTIVAFDSLRRGVSSELSRFAAAIGALLLLLTILLIVNSMVVSVIARTSEIGLRRALGCSRSGIAALFLTDGGVTGCIGGLAGSALACVAMVAVAALNHWSVELSWTHLAAGPTLGLVVGLAASTYPAIRAARISPAEAVRSE